MKHSHTLAALLAVFASFMVAACGDTSDNQPSGAGGTDSSVTLRFFVQESIADGPNRSLAGVEVCEADTSNCITTEESGFVELDLPAEQEVIYTIEKEGYAPWIVGDVTDENFRGQTWEMFPREQLRPIAERLDTPYPWEGGIVAVAALPIDDASGSLAGVTYELVEANGKGFYFDEDTRLYTQELDATTLVNQQSLLPLSMGGFAEVAPGMVQVEYGGAVTDCPRLSFGLPGDGPNRIRMPVRDGYITYASMHCEAPEE